jgi:hypothetical protein
LLRDVVGVCRHCDALERRIFMDSIITYSVTAVHPRPSVASHCPHVRGS